jgi:hypothetical protein
VVCYRHERWLTPKGETRAQAPDQHAERMRGIAAIGHDPQRKRSKKAQQTRRHRQFIGLSRRQHKADRATGAIRYDTGLGGEATARAAKRLTLVPLG